MALDTDYYKATELHEKIAPGSVSNDVMCFSVKEYLFRAGNCHLAPRDILNTQGALAEHRDKGKDFENR